MNNKLAVVEATPVAVSEKWGGAAERGLIARREREKIIAEVLKEGPDYGIIPGTDKPTLLKPGAEKTVDSLNLWPDYEPVRVVEDFEKPLFHYAYRCVLKERGSNIVVESGMGSCNSMETKYRWREGQRLCPKCGKATIIKGKKEFGGGWLCFAKKGGCGSKWGDGAKEIEGQKVERVANEAVFDQVNTIDKMAQKRALIAATLNLGFSQHFTQDLEDFENGTGPVANAEKNVEKAAEVFDATAWPEFKKGEPAEYSEYNGKTNLWIRIGSTFSEEWAEAHGFVSSKRKGSMFQEARLEIAKLCREMIDGAVL